MIRQDQDFYFNINYLNEMVKNDTAKVVYTDEIYPKSLKIRVGGN